MRVFTRVYINLSKRARALFPLCICAALFCYFALHFAGGKHGLESHERLVIKVAELKANLKDLTTEKVRFQKRIDLVGVNRAKKDMVDELARKSLQYAAPDELVLFD